MAAYGCSMGTSETVVAGATESRWVRTVVVLREITVGGLAGLVGGVVVAGVGGRLVMRLTSLVGPSSSIGRTTDSGFRVGTVTIVGSLDVLLFLGLGFGLLGGIMLVILWPWVSGWSRWRGVAVGGFVLAMGSTEAIDPHNIDFYILGNRAFLVALFVALFFAWAFLAVWLRDLLARLLPDRSRVSTVAYVLVTLVGLLFLPIVPFTLFDSVSDVPITVGVSVMLVALATGAMWIARIWEIRGPVIRGARWVGYGGYAGTLAFGLVQAMSDAWRIIT
jgi:hypothetical protein